MKVTNNGNKENSNAERLAVRPQLILAVGTQAQIVLRHLLQCIAQYFGFLPPYIVPLALDSTGQVSCEASLLAERHFLNFAQPKAGHVMRHVDEYPGVESWLSPGSHKPAIGNGAAGERAAGAVCFMTALQLITQALTERLGQLRSEVMAGIEAECNRDQRLMSKGITVDGSMVDVWILSTTVGGTCAATVPLSVLLAKLAREQGVRLTQNLLLLAPEIAAEEGMPFTERHKRTNSYAAFAELYSAMVCQPFALETLTGILEQEGELFQSIVVAEPPTGGLERLTRQLAETLFHLSTGAIGTQYHRKGVDVHSLVTTQNGEYQQRRIFNAIGSATLYAAPQNAGALAGQMLLCGVLEQLLSEAPVTAVSFEQLNEGGVTFAKLRDLHPSLAPMHPKWMTVSSVENGIIARSQVLGAELQRLVETTRAEAKKRLEAGRRDLERGLLETLQRHGCRAAARQCGQIVELLAAEREAMGAERARLAPPREGGGTAQQRLEAYNRRNQLALEGQSLNALIMEHKRLQDWFTQWQDNAQAILERLDRLRLRHENLREDEAARAEQTRPHRVLDAGNIGTLLKDQQLELSNHAVLLLESAIGQGELNDVQVEELRSHAIRLAGDLFKRNLSVRDALAMVKMDAAAQQKVFRRVLQAAQPSLRLQVDYDQIEEHVFVSLSEADTDLLAVIRGRAPKVICSQQWCDQAIVVVRGWYGIEPSAMPSVHEARTAFAREVDLLAQSSDGATREVVPFIDRRFQAPCLVVPSAARRVALLLIPLSIHVKGPIEYDPAGTYVYRKANNVITLGRTRQQAFDSLIREEYRLPGLPPLHEFRAWSNKAFDTPEAEQVINLLEQMITRQEQHLKDPDLVLDRLILEDELQALEWCCRDRRSGLRRQVALLKANGHRPGSPHAPETLAT